MATQKEVAEHIDLTDRQVRTLIKRGIIPPGRGAGGLNIDHCRVAYIQYLRGMATGQVKANQDALDAQQERARLTHHQANIAALDEDRLKGELIPVEDVARVIGDDYANVRAKLLSMPPKVAPQLVGVSLEKAKDIIDRQIREALEELSADDVYSTDNEPCA